MKFEQFQNELKTANSAAMYSYINFLNSNTGEQPYDSYVDSEVIYQFLKIYNEYNNLDDSASDVEFFGMTDREELIQTVKDQFNSKYGYHIYKLSDELITKINEYGKKIDMDILSNMHNIVRAPKCHVDPKTKKISFSNNYHQVDIFISTASAKNEPDFKPEINRTMFGGYPQSTKSLNKFLNN